MAQWTAVGFAHGVMNTDNMSIVGITLDYGPYGFLDDYDAGFICNHTDHEGRYAFGRQPAIGMWNCARLGEALMLLDPAVLADPTHPQATEPWQAALESYWPAFNREYARLMRAKLGLAAEQQDDAELIRDLLGLLQEERADYPIFFRELCQFKTAGRPGGKAAEESTGGQFPPGRPDVLPSAKRSAWFDRYRARLLAEQSDDAERRHRMLRVNPKYVLRNWVAQEAIERAEHRDFTLIEELRRLFRDPCAEHPGMERFAEPPRGAAREIVVSCSS